MDSLLTEYVDKPAGNAYQCGYNARVGEMPAKSNPHLVNTPDYRSWMAGWYGADFELEDSSGMSL